MLISESFHYVRSDAKLHFQNTLPIQASQYANLQMIPGTGRGDVKGYLTSIKIQSIQRLDWRVELHSRRISEASAPFFTPGATTFNSLLSYISFAKEQATPYATSFLYYRDGLKIPYLDEDMLGEVHVNLLNQDSATAKLPGDTGAIHIAFGFTSAA